MDGPCRLRPATSRDLGLLVELEDASFTDPWSRAQLAEALSWAGSCALLAEEGPDAVGYILGRVIVDEAEILSLAIASAQRRRGVGRQLLEAMLAWMAGRGAASVWLEVRRSNEAARRLYEGAHFTHAAVRRGYYRHPVEDAIILRRQL